MWFVILILFLFAELFLKGIDYSEAERGEKQKYINLSILDFVGAFAMYIFSDMETIREFYRATDYEREIMQEYASSMENLSWIFIPICIVGMLASGVWYVFKALKTEDESRNEEIKELRAEVRKLQRQNPELYDNDGRELQNYEKEPAWKKVLKKKEQAEANKGTIVCCQACGTSQRSNRSVCYECGAKLPEKVALKPETAEIVCRNCGKAYPKETKFCAKCGKELAPTEVKQVFCYNCGKKQPYGNGKCIQCGTILVKPNE